MSEPPLPRRDFLLGVAGIGGTVALAAQLRAIAAYAAVVPEQAAWEFFTLEEAADFDAVSAQIVPTDETAGAREARVVRFADHALATAFQGNQSQFRTDLKLLADFVEERVPGTRSFARLDETRQLELLTAFARANRAAFDRLRGFTMRGMFSHPVHGGNYRKIGWKLIGFDDRGSWRPPFGYYDRG